MRKVQTVYIHCLNKMRNLMNKYQFKLYLNSKKFTKEKSLISNNLKSNLTLQLLPKAVQKKNVGQRF